MTAVVRIKHRKAAPPPPYTPPASLVEAVRQELLRAIDEPDLPENLGAVTNIAREGGELLVPGLGRSRHRSPLHVVHPHGPMQKPMTITYKEAPAPLVEEIRQELRRMATEEDLCKSLPGLLRFARQADDLVCLLRAPEAIQHKENAVFLGSAGSSPSNAETYGATMLREIFAQLGSFQQREKESLVSLTSALAMARSTGMTDVAQKLEQKLLGAAASAPGAPHPVTPLEHSLTETTPAPPPEAE